MGGRKQFLGERIITCNGKVVAHTDLNHIDNYKKDMVICSCGRIMQDTTWRHHIHKPICVNFHKVTNKILDWKPI